MFNFRKIASVFASAVMIGSTVGIAAAANYPAPFVQGGNANVAIVYGTNAQATDFVAAMDISSSLSAALARQSFGVAPTSASVSGGESVNLATTSQKLYSNSPLNIARSVLTKTELPTLLKDGKAYDNSGTTYDYTQTITLGGASLTFDKSGESIDPILYVDIGTTPGNFYNYTLTLTKALNVSSPNVIGYAEFEILGNKYTVGANSDHDTLYLYGSGVEATIAGGEQKTVSFNGKDYTVKLISTSSANAASVEINGMRRSVVLGSSYKFGDVEVYIKDITHPNIQGDPRDIVILLGANTLHFEDKEQIRVGADDVPIENTKAVITGNAGVGITKLIIQQAAESSTGDYIGIGKSFEDRVFGGLKVIFAGINPALDDNSREEILFTANELSASVGFKSALARDKGSYTLDYARDADGVANSLLNVINLVDSNNKTIHVIEGANAKVDEIVVVNAGDKGRLLKVSSIPSNSTASNKVTFRDIITGESFEFTTGFGQSASNNIDGQTYYVAVNNGESVAQVDRTVNITWGVGATSGSPGTYTTLFPRIQLANGGWISFLTETNVSNATSLALPGEFLLSDYETGATLGFSMNENVSRTLSTNVGVVNWTFFVPFNSTNALLNGISSTGSSIDCNFNRTFGPAVLFMEPKTAASANGNAICIPLTKEGTDPVTVAIGTPVFTDGVASFKQLKTDSYTSHAVDLYGTWVSRDTTNQNTVKIKYPSEQMFADVLFASDSVTVTPGTSGSTGTGSVRELGSIAIPDSLVASVSGKNLIVIGGSCVNTVAADLLGSSTPLCGDAFEQRAGVGHNQFLIKTFAKGGNVATLVAGYNAIDTTNAAKYLTTQTVDIAVGKAYKGTSATSAELITSST